MNLYFYLHFTNHVSPIYKLAQTYRLHMINAKMNKNQKGITYVTNDNV